VSRWRSSFSGPAYVQDIARCAEKLGIRYAMTTSGDEAFLDWCSDTRRGCAINCYDAHAVTFCGWDAEDNAVILDNRNTSKFYRYPRKKFLAMWRAQGGTAITAVYSPVPPIPCLD